MGEVIAKNVELRNYADEVAVNLKVRDEVRNMKVDMVADTGAVETCLPQSVVEKLGLPFLKDIKARLADGSVRQLKLYDALTVCIDDRTALVRCIANPDDKAPSLLGQIVFEQIDYIVDCRNQKILPNPESEPGILTLKMY